MQIRQATPADAPLIARLLAQLGYPTTSAAVRERLARLGEEDRVLLCEEGFVAVHRVPLVAEGGCCARITALVVALGHREAGVGRALVAEAEALAREWGCGLLEVSSARRPERLAAHSFYPALGFDDSGRDSIRYWKRLE
jgi:GNAT superfamily N-acetyltransferase